MDDFKEDRHDWIAIGGICFRWFEFAVVLIGCW